MNAYVTQTKDFDSSENVPAVKAHLGLTFTPVRTREHELTQYGTTRFQEVSGFPQILVLF